MADDSKTQPPISCLWGTPYLDTDGVWKCPSAAPGATVTPLGGDGGAMPPFGRRQAQTITNYYYYLGAQPVNPYPTGGLPTGGDQPPATAPKTILGMSPLMLGVVAAGALYVLSSMDTGKK